MTTNQRCQQGEAGRFYGASGAGFPLGTGDLGLSHSVIGYGL